MHAPRGSGSVPRVGSPPAARVLAPGRPRGSGCGHEAKIDFTSVSEPPTVRLIHPQVRNIVRVVGQPSFIEAYERTSIYPEADRPTSRSGTWTSATR